MKLGPFEIPENEFSYSVARSSGPGGQNVNKVNSKVILRWNVMESPTLPLDVRLRFLEKFGSKLTRSGEVLITSEEARDQIRNRETCLKKLITMLEMVAEPPKRRRKTRPSRTSVVKGQELKRKHAVKKQNRGRVRGWD